MMLSDRIQRMQSLLQKNLQPTFLEIIDDSEKHKNHAGAAGGMGHYTIKIGSQNFAGKPLVEVHRMVYSALGNMLETDIHALKISIIKE